MPGYRNDGVLTWRGGVAHHTISEFCPRVYEAQNVIGSVATYLPLGKSCVSKFKLVRIILHEISQYTIHSCISKERYAKWINLQINGEELGAISAEEIERHGE